jgi:glyoxylase-like metal-dependent hydrolase (beta-lactamase superfamily II)
MDIRTFVLGSFGVSAYLVAEGTDAVLVDAPEGSEAIIRSCDARGLAPRILVNTHGHFDHIAANAALKARWPEMTLAIGTADAAMLTSPLRNLGAVFGLWVKSPAADRRLEDGDRLEAGAVVLEVIATPGHSKGGISLYLAQGPDGTPAVFTGDTLMAGGVGRTDFPGASPKTLLESIRTRLLTLPPQTLVYPGHGGATTVGAEARTNPYV